MGTAYIALGSNLHEPLAQLHRAIKQLMQVSGVNVQQSSAFFQNAPLGALPQPDYVNAVVKLGSDLDPVALLLTLQVIEYSQGRRRDSALWASRTLDLDLLCYDNTIMDTPLLTLPHPRLTERAFVVLPLLSIAPELSLPYGQRLASYRHLFREDSLHEIAPSFHLDISQPVSDPCH